MAPVTPRDARPLPYVQGPMPLDEVLAAMRRHRAQMAVVMDRHGGTAGLVTMEDLFMRNVGDIEEAHRPDVDRYPACPGPHPCPRHRSSAGRPVKRSAVTLEHAKVTTISGLVLTLLGRPTTVGEHGHLAERAHRSDRGRRERRGRSSHMRIAPPDA